ncbi:uncharacterized protein V1518DRAFT_418706 [Limtongia smithiae]|uniref:uncharacterized protein n=1 Tax=Limtongia smithiae TaxID=1125753 RepID=UPI0034CE96C8
MPSSTTSTLRSFFSTRVCIIRILLHTNTNLEFIQQSKKKRSKQKIQCRMSFDGDEERNVIEFDNASVCANVGRPSIEFFDDSSRHRYGPTEEQKLLSPVFYEDNDKEEWSIMGSLRRSFRKMKIKKAEHKQRAKKRDKSTEKRYHQPQDELDVELNSVLDDVIERYRNSSITPSFTKKTKRLIRRAKRKERQQRTTLVPIDINSGLPDLSQISSRRQTRSSLYTEEEWRSHERGFPSTRPVSLYDSYPPKDWYGEIPSSASSSRRSRSSSHLHTRSNRFGHWKRQSASFYSSISAIDLPTRQSFQYVDVDPYQSRAKQLLDAYRNPAKQERFPRYEQLLEPQRLERIRAKMLAK